MKTTKSSASSQFLALLLTSALCAAAIAGEPVTPAAGERVIAMEGAKKEVVRHSMIGIRDTLVFYTGKQAVLVLRVDNTTPDLKTSGTLYLFAPDTTDESLGKWVNNQHSDGLFPDVPTPTLTHKLPEGTCSVTDRKLVGEQKSHGGNEVFNDYQVKISVKEHQLPGKFRLPAFATEANVYVKK